MPKPSFITPEGWPRARGYSHGVVAQGQRVLVSGQFGKDPSAALVSADHDFGVQWGLALKNVVAVVQAAGASAQDIVMMRAYLTDISHFTTFGQAVGAGWGAVLGKHFPAMTIVQVGALLDGNALVEIEAEAVVPVAD